MFSGWRELIGFSAELRIETELGVWTSGEKPPTTKRYRITELSN